MGNSVFRMYQKYCAGLEVAIDLEFCPLTRLQLVHGAISLPSQVISENTVINAPKTDKKIPCQSPFET